MIHSDILLCLLSISAYLVTNTVAREAIVGGEKADIRDFPYGVILLIEGEEECGGGIIDDSHIITAAHCVVLDDGDITNHHITILAGTINSRKTGEPAVKVRVKKVFVLKEFKIGELNTKGDIAVLKLEHPLDFEKHENLKHLELPVNEKEHYYGKKAKIAGFGWNWVKEVRVTGGLRRMGGVTDSHLRFIEADVVDDADCQAGYTNKKLAFEKEFCARAKQHDNVNSYGVCTGDSGGPLVIDGKIVIGILSQSSPSCSERSRAALYTRVAHYLSFIDHAKHDRKHDDIITRVLLP